MTTVKRVPDDVVRAAQDEAYVQAAIIQSHAATVAEVLHRQGGHPVDPEQALRVLDVVTTLRDDVANLQGQLAVLARVSGAGWADIGLAVHVENKNRNPSKVAGQRFRDRVAAFMSYATRKGADQ